MHCCRPKFKSQISFQLQDIIFLSKKKLCTIYIFLQDVSNRTNNENTQWGKKTLENFLSFYLYCSSYSFLFIRFSKTYVHTYDMYCDVYNQCAYCGNLVEVVIREWQILNSLFVHPLTEKSLELYGSQNERI